MPKSNRYPLIFNPNAKSQKGERAFRFFMQNADRFALYASRDVNDATQLTRHFVSQGASTIIAAGGDGTLNSVVKGMIGSAATLGVMPAGTMNVFARELGIPQQLEQALAIIDSRHTREIDLFSVNEQPFIQMAGIGFDAKVIEDTTWELKKKFGPLAYLITGFKVLKETPPKIRIKSAEGIDEEGVAVLIGNGGLYGGQFKLFRDADPNDSKLDIIVFKEAGYRMLFDSFNGLIRGGIDLSESTRYFQTSSFEVTSETEVPLEIDGEWGGKSKQFTFKHTDQKLRVHAPADAPVADNLLAPLLSQISWPNSQRIDNLDNA